MSLTPPAPTRPVPHERAERHQRVCAGIDWASQDHAVCVLEPDGSIGERFTVTHDTAGLRGLVRRLLRAGVEEVGIERGDGAVVDALMTAGLTVLVIAPGQVKNLRSRYGTAGNKDDRFDAYVLADVVRTDRARLRALEPSTPATLAMRTTVRARRDLVDHRVAAANQLRAHLQIVLPGVIGLFRDIDSSITLSFLERFSTQAQVDWLSPQRLEAWLKKVSYTGGVDAAVLHARLTAAPRGTTGPEATTHAAVTAAYVATLRVLNTQIATLEADLSNQLKIHPETHIYTALPHAQTLRVARLIAEIGDARGRFPTPESLAALAGVVPSTRQSGKVKAVTFRWGCNKQLRDTLCDFAGDSRFSNPWAADLYTRARARGHDHPHAVRILARAWTYIIWRCWHDQVAYNPTRHRALQNLLQQTPHAA